MYTIVGLLPQAPKILLFFFLVNREFADPIVAERTIEFLIANKTKILSSFPNLIPQVRTLEMLTYSELANSTCSSYYSCCCRPLLFERYKTSFLVCFIAYLSFFYENSRGGPYLYFFIIIKKKYLKYRRLYAKKLEKKHVCMISYSTNLLWDLLISISSLAIFQTRLNHVST